LQRSEHPQQSFQAVQLLFQLIQIMLIFQGCCELSQPVQERSTQIAYCGLQFFIILLKIESRSYPTTCRLIINFPSLLQMCAIKI